MPQGVHRRWKNYIATSVIDSIEASRPVRESTIEFIEHSDNVARFKVKAMESIRYSDGTYERFAVESPTIREIPV